VQIYSESAVQLPGAVVEVIAWGDSIPNFTAYVDDIIVVKNVP
jgi:hypothetical protein